LFSSEKFFDWFVFGVGLAFIVFCVYSFTEETKGERECKKKHQGEAYYEEKLITKNTNHGCRVIRLTRFTGDCLYINDIYLTECQGYTSLGDGSNPNDRPKNKLTKEIEKL